MNSNGIVNAMERQPDGRILIAGNFTSYAGLNRNGVARLNADGTLDMSFDPGTGPSSGGIGALALQPDGKILIGGLFAAFET